MEYEFVEAYRSLNKDKEAEKPIIFYNYKYSYSSTNKAGKYYRCICRDTCKASVSTQGKLVIKINGKTYNLADPVEIEKLVRQSHTGHAEDDINKDCIKAIDTMKKRSSTESTNAEKIYQEEYNKLVDRYKDISLISEHFPQYDSIKSTLYAKKSQNFPRMFLEVEKVKI